jgi:hypothetical protein
MPCFCLSIISVGHLCCQWWPSTSVSETQLTRGKSRVRRPTGREAQMAWETGNSREMPIFEWKIPKKSCWSVVGNWSIVSYCIQHIIYIYLEEPLGTFFCPRRLGGRIGTVTRKIAKLGRFIYIDVWCRHFCLKMFFVLRHHFVPRHFYPEVRRKNPESRRKNPESRRKKAELGEFCSKHFSAPNNMTRPYKNLSASAFFWGLGIYSGNRQK